MPNCWIVDCSQPNAQHCLPVDEDRRRVWLHRSGRAENDVKNANLNYIRFCSRHFENQPRYGCDPTLYLPKYRKPKERRY